MRNGRAAADMRRYIALDKQVGLAVEQKPQMREVFLEEGENLFAVFGDTTLSDTQKQARIQQIQVVAEQKVWSLLTNDTAAAHVSRSGHSND